MTRDVDVTETPVEAMVAEAGADVRLTTREAAKLLGVTEERMRTLALDERVPAEMVSHRWWFGRDELLRIKRECPEAIYARRTPAVVAATQARREQSRANMLRLNATQDRHEAARRGYLGLLAKIAKEVDPQGILPAEERERRVQMRYRAQLAEARARKRSAQRPMTREEMIAGVEERARQQAEREHGRHDDGQQALEFCYQCWRENAAGRPPAWMVNALCERHQRENDEFAASLRAAS